MQGFPVHAVVSRVSTAAVTVDDAVVEAGARALARKIADTRKGRRPSWQDAAPAAVAEPLVAEVVAELRRRGTAVATRVFGAGMRVSSVNEGPMTLLLEV